MSLFGTELDGPTIASLVGLVATLILWLFVLCGERSQIRWFRDWEAQRKARRDAEIAAQGGEPPAPDKTRGPWG